MSTILLDQNIPESIASWLSKQLPRSTIHHANSLGMSGQSDDILFRWAQQHNAIIATYDEDFADARTYPLGQHCGVIRFRVWPTTTENTQRAFARLIERVAETDWPDSLIIIDNYKIRIRRSHSG